MAAHFALKCEGLSIWTLGRAGGYQREEIHREPALAIAAHFALTCEGLSTLHTIYGHWVYQREERNREPAMDMAAHFALNCEGLSTVYMDTGESWGVTKEKKYIESRPWPWQHTLL